MWPDIVDLLLQAVLAAVGNDQLIRVIAMGEQRIEQAVEVMLAIAQVVHTPASLLQVGGEVAHGAEDKGDFLLVVAYIGGFGRDFCHQQGVAGLIERTQGGEVGAELVAEDEAKFHGRSCLQLSSHTGYLSVKQQ